MAKLKLPELVALIKLHSAPTDSVSILKLFKLGLCDLDETGTSPVITAKGISHISKLECLDTEATIKIASPVEAKKEYKIRASFTEQYEPGYFFDLYKKCGGKKSVAGRKVNAFHKGPMSEHIFQKKLYEELKAENVHVNGQLAASLSLREINKLLGFPVLGKKDIKKALA